MKNRRIMPIAEKAYQIFKDSPINISTYWDNYDIFCIFYENDQFLACCELLFELFSNNKDINLNIFETSVFELWLETDGVSKLYYPNLKLAKQSQRNQHGILHGKTTIFSQESGLSIEEVEYENGIKIVSEKLSNEEAIKWLTNYQLILDDANVNDDYEVVDLLKSKYINWLHIQGYTKFILPDILIDKLSNELFSLDDYFVNNKGQLISFRDSIVIFLSEMTIPEITEQDYLRGFNFTKKLIEDYLTGKETLSEKNIIEYMNKVAIHYSNSKTAQFRKGLESVIDKIKIHLNNSKSEAEELKITSEEILTDEFTDKYIDFSDIKLESMYLKTYLLIPTEKVYFLLDAIDRLVTELPPPESSDYGHEFTLCTLVSLRREDKKIFVELTEINIAPDNYGLIESTNKDEFSIDFESGDIVFIKDEGEIQERFFDGKENLSNLSESSLIHDKFEAIGINDIFAQFSPKSLLTKKYGKSLGIGADWAVDVWNVATFFGFGYFIVDTENDTFALIKKNLVEEESEIEEIKTFDSDKLNELFDYVDKFIENKKSA